MKIEISEEVIERIGAAAKTAAIEVAKQELADLEEAELLRELREDTTLDAKGKVLAYLDRSKRNVVPYPFEPTERQITVSNKYLREALGISVPAMKKVRDALWEDGHFLIPTKKRPILLMHLQE